MNNNDNQREFDDISNRLNSAVRHSENAMKSGLTTLESKQKEYSIKHNDTTELRDKISDKDVSTIADSLKTRSNDLPKNPEESPINRSNISENTYSSIIEDRSKHVEETFLKNNELNTTTDSSSVLKNKEKSSENKIDDLSSSMLKTKEDTSSKVDFKEKMERSQDDQNFDLNNIKNKIEKTEQIKNNELNQLKTSITNNSNNEDSTLNALKTTLKNKEELAEKNGIHLKTKNGKVHSDHYIKGVGFLNKKTFNFKQNQSTKSKVATVGLTTSKKTAGLVGKGTRLVTMANGVAGNEDAIEGGVNAVKTIAKAPINKAKNKLYNKTKTVALKGGVKTIKIAARGVKMAMMSLIKVLGSVVGGASFMFIPCALVLIVICGFLSIFTGSPKTRENYETIFSEIQKEFDDDVRTKTKKFENMMEKTPSKSDFEGISESDYKKLIEEQWKEDTVFIQGFSQIDWKAQLVIIQNLKNNPEIEDSPNKEEIKAVLQYWKDKGVMESHSDSESEEKYKVKWINHYIEDIEEKSFVAKTKSASTNKANNYINSLENQNVEKINFQIEYEKIMETYEDEKGEEKERIKEWKATVKGTIEKKKEEEKEYTRTLYSIAIENGNLDDYINQTNEAFKNNDTVSVGYQGNLKIETLLAEKREYEKWDKIKDSMEEQIREMYNQEGFMDEFSEKFRGSDNVTDFGGMTYDEGQYPFKGTLDEWNLNNTFRNPRLNGQCTWFAYGRYYQTHNSHIPVHGNAGTWISECLAGGYTNIGKVPKVNSVIVLGSTSTSGEYAGCGHVAFIEAIEDDGKGGIKSITISQGNVGAPSQEVLMKNPFKYTKVSKFDSVEALVKWLGNSYYLVGFIY